MLIEKPKTDEEKMQEAYKEKVKVKAEQYGYQRTVKTPESAEILEQLMTNLIGTVKMKDQMVALQISKALAEMTNFWTLLFAESNLREEMLLTSQVNFQKAFIGQYFMLSKQGANEIEIKNDELTINDEYFESMKKRAEYFLETAKTKIN